MPKLSDAPLIAMRALMDKGRTGGRDYAGAVAAADTYVSNRAALFAPYQNMSIEECVAEVDAARIDDDETKEWVVKAWLMHKFPPQNIGGKYEPRTRA